MKRYGLVFLGVLFSGFILSACWGGHQIISRAEPNERVLEFNKPFDIVYLRTYEAFDSLDHWTQDLTRKENGIIGVRNADFKRFDDADKRRIILSIRRDGDSKTLVSILPEHQHVLGGAKILDHIEAFVNTERFG